MPCREKKKKKKSLESTVEFILWKIFQKRKCFHSFRVEVHLLYTKHLCMAMCVSVGGQAGCEIWIDVSIWRQVFRVWLRAAAASVRLGLPPLWVQPHHRLWLLVVIGVWNLNMPFHYSKFGLCWRVGNSRGVFGFFLLFVAALCLCSSSRYAEFEILELRLNKRGNSSNPEHVHICSAF